MDFIFQPQTRVKVDEIADAKWTRVGVFVMEFSGAKKKKDGVDGLRGGSLKWIVSP